MNEFAGTEQQSAILRPSPFLRTLWIIEWALVTLLFLLPFIAPWLTSTRSEVVSMTGGTILLWLLVALPVGIWIPLYHRSHEVEINEWEVRQYRGVVSKKSIVIPLANINTIQVSSGPFERLFGLERLRIFTSDPQVSAFRRPVMVIPGMTDAEAVGELLLRGAPQFADALSRAKGSDRELLETLLNEVRSLRRRLVSE